MFGASPVCRRGETIPGAIVAVRLIATALFVIAPKGTIDLRVAAFIAGGSALGSILVDLLQSALLA